MVSKCANPECSAKFRYFHSGQLFRVETPASAGAENEMNRHVSRLEFFWLCDDCAGKLTLVLEKGVGISVQPKLARAAAIAA